MFLLELKEVIRVVVLVAHKIIVIIADHRFLSHLFNLVGDGHLFQRRDLGGLLPLLQKHIIVRSRRCLLNLKLHSLDIAPGCFGVCGFVIIVGRLLIRPCILGPLKKKRSFGFHRGRCSHLALRFRWLGYRGWPLYFDGRYVGNLLFRNHWSLVPKLILLHFKLHGLNINYLSVGYRQLNLI